MFRKTLVKIGKKTSIILLFSDNSSYLQGLQTPIDRIYQYLVKVNKKKKKAIKRNYIMKELLCFSRKIAQYNQSNLSSNLCDKSEGGLRVIAW